METAAGFLVEFDSACSLFRLYGREHPAFCRQCEATAVSGQAPLSVSVSQRGFTLGADPLPENADVQRLAQRLRSLGLVGIEVRGQLNAKQVESLVLALDDAEKKSKTGEAVVQSLSAATDGNVNAVALKLDGLRLVEGSDLSTEAQARAAWEPLFSQSAMTPPAQELAESFERSLRGSQSSAHWKALVDVWLRELSAVGKTGADTSKGAAPRKVDAVAAFLQQLSPPMCQRLLTETISDHSHSEHVVLSLAERLPTGTLLGALSSVSRSSGGPSSAALALLRRCATQVSGSAEQLGVPVTNEQLAEAADTLSKLLGSDHEGTFVPTEYLRRREELSRPAAESHSAEAFVTWPDERQTMSHAAQLTFDILSTPNASVKHLTAALEYVKSRVHSWVSSGEFTLAGDAVALAVVLAMHEDPAVAKPAEALVSTAVNFEDLLAGARSAPDRHIAVGQIADLLGQAQGAVLAGALANATANSNTWTPTITAAIARAFPRLSQQSLAILFSNSKDALPPALLGVLGAMAEADALDAAQLLLSAAPAAVRLPLVELIFKGKHPWPVPLIEHLLKDSDRTVRRLAAMRLVRDADLATAASILHAASGEGQFEPDVGVFLAELLHHHRREAAVRGAYRQWWWSARRWSALFSWRAESRRQAG